MKSLFEKLLVIISSVVLIPMLALIALLIKLLSKGPVFYTQTRIGQYGKVFTMYKFRTMSVDAEKNTGPVWATNDDLRPYPFGNFLRVTGLDELPQIINILRNDMALIGPRPERPFFVKQFNMEYKNYSRRHLVKPGVIGWAQVNGWRGDTSLQKRLECDLYYVYNYSWLLDVKILTLLTSRGWQTQHV